MHEGCFSNQQIFYPLTHPQKRIWYIEKIYPNTSLYNIGGPIRIKGPIDFELLEEAINLFVQSNDGLRLRILEQDGDVKQYVSNFEKFKIDFFDFSVSLDPEGAFKKWFDHEAHQPFQLEGNKLLFYFAMFRINEYDNGYLAKFHHIIADGWSINLMTEQICQIYLQLFRGEKVPVQAQCSYLEYLTREQDYLSSDRFQKDKSFWNKKLEDIPGFFLNKNNDKLEGERKTFELPIEISMKIKEFASANKNSLNTIFVVLYLLYIYKTTQQEEIIIGTPVLNRSGRKEKAMFGMFTSTMPFKFTLNNDISILEFTCAVNAELMNCYYHQKYPYELLVQDLEIQRKGFNNLFNGYVNYYNTKLNTELNGYPIENIEFYNGHQIYSLQWVIKDWSELGSLTLEIDYKLNEYTEQQIEDMYRHLTNLIHQIVADPQEKVAKLSLISEPEKNWLIHEFNNRTADYPKEKTIYQLFQEQVERTPHKVALSFNGFELSYRQLNDKANQLAWFLMEKGVKTGTIVALITHHSMETVIGIMAIIKAGGAYLPLAPDCPENRMNLIMKDAATPLILTNCDIVRKLVFEGEIIDFNLIDTGLYPVINPEIWNLPHDLVYIIYTSGSTGKPKGVMIEHQGLVNYIWWAQKMYLKDSDEIFPLYSSLAFDLTVTSIFTPLISGNQIMIYNDDQSDFVLHRVLKDNKATVVKLTPSHLTIIQDFDFAHSNIRRFIVGGEDFKTQIAARIYKSFEGRVEIYNEYGPTETVVGCMIEQYEPEEDSGRSVPIGVPADNVMIYLLDKNLNPLPKYVSGEIYISGDGVARGYLNKPDLTRECFIDDPFVPGLRMYKTGDLARFLRNGKIDYLGRIDHQIKINGYRIELGEIENLLLKYKAVKEAIAIDREDAHHQHYICAYVATAESYPEKEIKDYLLRFLPEYMIPRYIVTLSQMPLTANGKVDDKLLPEPFRPNMDSVFVPFRNKVEEAVVMTVQQVLNIDRISLKDNFNYLGGDSIKAIQIAAQLNEKGLKIKVKDILSNPIIEDMTAYIRTNIIETEQGQCSGFIKKTPIVAWFINQNFNDPNYWCQSVLLTLNQNIDVPDIELIFDSLIKHHDSLRINYDTKAGLLFYNEKYLREPFRIQVFDFSSLPHPEQLANMKLAGEQIRSIFNIEEDIMLKAVLFNLGPSGKRLLLIGHHLITDGVSWRIILEDLRSIYEQISSGLAVKLPSKTDSIQRWAKIMEEHCRTSFSSEKPYWEVVLNNRFQFPEDFQLGDPIAASSSTINGHLNFDETIDLLTKANKVYGTEPRELLIAALALTISNLTAKETILIELEGHGREEIYGDLEISRTIGWFTTLYPVALQVVGKLDLSSQLKSLKEQLRKVPNNGLGYGVLKYLTGELPGDNDKLIRFNFLGDFDNSFHNNYFDYSFEDSGSNIGKSNHLTSLMDINTMVMEKKLRISITYSANQFRETSMTTFLYDMISNIKWIIGHCCAKKDVEFTPSDFETINVSQADLDKLFF